MIRIYIILILFVLISNNFSQIKNYYLKGRVTDYKNNPIPDVIVDINSGQKTTVTNGKGFFAFNLPMDKEYHLYFYHVNYKLYDTIIYLNNNLDISVKLFDSTIVTKNIVITGTRTKKEVNNSPIPVEIVSNSEIKQTGSNRLDDIIGEQVGMNLIEDHGKGVQIQGLDPTFALILINSEPVIGTMTGKLNLDRFSVVNLKRLEIVKGPSSSLYGSNALAGVINLITEKPTDTKIGLFSKYGTFNTLDLSIDGAVVNSEGTYGMSLFLNRLSSDGYQLNFSNTKQVLSSFSNYTISGEGFYNFINNTELILRFRYNQENQKNQFGVNSQDLNSAINDEGILKDFNISFNAKHNYSPNKFVNLRLYGTSYSTETEFFTTSQQANENTDFYQKLGKGELQFDWLIQNQHYLIASAGGILEQVNSDIISNKKRRSYSYYGFVQDDWTPLSSLNLVASLRFDSHSDYSSSLNPKFAVSYKLFPELTLKGSVGSGYKSPTFEQLYLAWNNPTSGYSVYGVAYLKEGLNKLKESGQILEVLIEPDKMSELKPENSWSFNVGLNFEFDNLINLNVNLFRNNVRDLIDFLRVAIKSNGLSLYTYSNFHRVHTQGLEAQLNLTLMKTLNLEVGYQLLEAIDDDVYDKVKNGDIWKRDIYGNDRPVKISEYGGLFNRSAHSGIIKIRYYNEDLGLTASLRGTLRSKYGYADLNGNSILDDEREYAPGFAIWNFTLTKELVDLFSLQFGVKNIFDKKDQRLLTRDPGRIFFVSLSFNYKFNQ